MNVSRRSPTFGHTVTMTPSTRSALLACTFFSIHHRAVRSDGIWTPRASDAGQQTHRHRTERAALQMLQPDEVDMLHGTGSPPP